MYTIWLGRQFKHVSFHITFDMIIEVGVVIENRENENPLFS